MTTLFLLLAMFLLSGSIQTSPAVTMDKLQESWKLYMDECELNNSRAPPNSGLVCNRTFDKYACWPDGLPNTTVSVSCPWYLPWYHKVQYGMVYQECNANGQWVTMKNTSECDSNDPSQQYYRHIRIMYTIGYSLSLVALVLALSILIFFRKLHCMRNNIHMNLFASFILRALSILIKDALMEANITSQDLSPDQDQGFSQASMSPVDLFVNNEITISCRVAAVMMQYSILANSYWLLVEGIYLHNLLVITVFTEKNYFQIYLCIGWGTPLIFLVPWVIAKYLHENQECWGQNINMNYWWIIRSPILVAVLINFLIFIHIIKILVSKLRAHQMRYTDYKFRLAKSTLTLIPLLGIHQVVFIYVTDEATETTIGLRLTKLVIDLFFSSFQGLLVAILYCFVNKEVQSEVLKKWKRWKLGRNIEEEYRHTYSNMPNTKTGSLLNHVSQPPPRLPERAERSASICSPEEWHMLVANGGGADHGKAAGQRGSPLHEGTVGHYTAVEDMGVVDKSRNMEGLQ
ncbi:glucagon receptor-like [Nerophis lumbriciformis]|uniref:glucagon receptor-like n=1 Tax=Nerophis lumbriciformis TaxID=546530 RepID=UPI003BA909AE